jgi:hypothetical protein
MATSKERDKEHEKVHLAMNTPLDRVAEGVGGGVATASREGEGLHPLS